MTDRTEVLELLLEHVETLLAKSTAFISAIELDHELDGEIWKERALDLIEQAQRTDGDRVKATVISLHNPEQGDAFDNREIVQTLEDLLGRARAGELSAVAYSVVTRDTSVATGWNGVHGTRYPLGVAISQLDFRYKMALTKAT